MFGIHRWPVNFPHKWPVTRKMFPFDDVIMREYWTFLQIHGELGLLRPNISYSMLWYTGYFSYVARKCYENSEFGTRFILTHWGWVTHICVSKLTIIGWCHSLSSGRRQAIIWTSVGIMSIGLLGTNFSEILSRTPTVSFKKMHMKMSAKWCPFCLGLNVLTQILHRTLNTNNICTQW